MGKFPFFPFSKTAKNSVSRLSDYKQNLGFVTSCIKCLRFMKDVPSTLGRIVIFEQEDLLNGESFISSIFLRLSGSFMKCDLMESVSYPTFCEGHSSRAESHSESSSLTVSPIWDTISFARDRGIFIRDANWNNSFSPGSGFPMQVI